MLDGKPLANATVSFQPIISKGPAGATEGMGSYGRTNAAGEFSLRLVDTDEEGAVIGTHVVRISVVQRSTGGDQISTADNKLPLSSQDGSERFTVNAEGKNYAEFDLKTP